MCQNLFLVEKILRNLIDNALKYTKTKILIRNVDNCFWVIDNGIGIDKKYQKKIFNDFFQNDGKCSDALEGVGLGLGIVNYSALLIGARMSLKSSKNNYTAFKVCL